MHDIAYCHLQFSELDGDQLMNLYWIDPMLTDEQMAANSKYTRKMYLQFETETR